jgi:ribosomal protein S18 acetylase RimI-like enzyme
MANRAEIPQALLLAKRLFPHSYVEYREGDAFFVAKSKGKIVGFAHAGEGMKGFVVRGIGVEPGLRGSGVGSMLLDAVLAYCKGKKAGKVVLAVDEENIAAARVYAKRGFVFSKRKGSAVLLSADEPN